jgi:hypothetical protein
MHGGSLSCAVVCDQREQASAGILVGDDETCSAQKDKDRTRNNPTRVTDYGDAYSILHTSDTHHYTRASGLHIFRY